MTKMAPPRRVYHSDRKTNFGGGVYSDTRAGTRSAKAGNYPWIDKNGHFMPASVADKVKPKNRKNLVWVNAHGAPHNPDWVATGKKFEDYAWSQKHKQHPTLQDSLGCFKTCKKFGRRVEWEPKDLHPLVTDEILDKMFEILAQQAEQVFGSKWINWVTIKCLTNLGGGIAYCFRILRAAHKAGFKTMVLARGEWCHKVINEPFITWNRGGKVA